MTMKFFYIGGAVLVLIIIVGAFLRPHDSMEPAMQEKDTAMTDDSMKDTDAMMDADGAMMKSGTYEAYSADKLALANSGNVVLFFRASWCPTCRTLDADIKANISSIPEGLTILDVDYDHSTALKQKYGVTTQHTLVQVDAEGNLIAKWTGSPTLTALAGEVR